MCLPDRMAQVLAYTLIGILCGRTARKTIKCDSDAIRAKIQESADKQTPTSTRVVVSGKVQGVSYLV